jgi:nucleoside-diphosphate-sugar epimerase
MVFCRAYLATSGPVVRLLILPVVLMVANAALGIYARLRQASSRKKAFVLLIGVLASGAAALALGAAAGPVILWSVVVYPPLALARLLLGLPYSKHERLISIAVNHRGPVLVIGGAGYIGCHAVDLLLQAGKRVRVLDRLMYGREPLAEFANRGNFELIEGDVTDVGRLAQAMKGASAVVHLAGLVGDPACAVDPQFTRHTNIVSTRMAREVAQSVGIQRFVFASSCSVYGATDKEARETDSLNPVSLYAQTKIDSERELLRGVPDGFFVTILRFATVFGHSRRSRFDLVANLFTAQAITDGLITVIGPQQWRPFIHVRDLARAIVLVLDAAPKLIQSEIFNVGDARLNMTILQLGEKVREVCRRYRDVSISISENVQDRRNYAVSFQKIHSLLGFEAATLMDAGIEEMAAAFQDGKYGHYREQIYSNVAMTAKVLSQFQNPDELSRLYAPLR